MGPARAAARKFKERYNETLHAFNTYTTSQTYFITMTSASGMASARASARKPKYKHNIISFNVTSITHRTVMGPARAAARKFKEGYNETLYYYLIHTQIPELYIFYNDINTDRALQERVSGHLPGGLVMV